MTERATDEHFRLGLEGIEGHTGRLRPDVVGDYDGDGIAFGPGDVLFGKLRPYLAKSWVSDRPGSAVGDFHVYRPLAGFDSAYFGYVLLSRAFLDVVTASVLGAKMPRASWDVVRNVEVHYPPLPEQRAIADYLDAQTAKIDALVGKQEQLIATLRERRAAVISRALEDPDLLAYATTLTRACHDVVDCPHTTPEVDDEGGFEAVRTGSVRGGGYRPEFSLRVSENTWRERNQGGTPVEGDVLFTREAPAGEACMVPEGRDVCLGQRMVLLRIDSDKAWGRFVLWHIYSGVVQDYFRLSTNGSTVGNLRLGLIRKTPILLPPLAEQRRIAAYLDEQTAKIDTLIAKAERFIEVSKERRSALITAAVTGQVDVRTCA